MHQTFRRAGGSSRLSLSTFLAGFENKFGGFDGGKVGPKNVKATGRRAEKAGD